VARSRGRQEQPTRRASAPGFLSAAEREFLNAAVARLIPADDLGAGAREAGCTEFIDRQVAGPYGQAETLYMQGPWAEGTETQGFQSRLTPAQSYRIGIAAVDEYCRGSYAGKSCRDLVPAEQDAPLTGPENGAIELSGIKSKSFFEMLLQNTLEGFWSDPIYGGNRDFVGWNLIGFPGARYDYSKSHRQGRRALSTSTCRPERPQRLVISRLISEGTCAMATKLPSVDVLLVGFGWTGAIAAQELTDAGLEVLALERGAWRDTPTDFATTFSPDELRYTFRNTLFQQPAHDTLSFRNNLPETALPMGKLGSFLPGSGVGGAGVHWHGQTWRFLPSDVRMRSHNLERYGKKFFAADMTVQDWGVTFDDLEPHYDRFEYLCGISGKAGNLRTSNHLQGHPESAEKDRKNASFCIILSRARHPPTSTKLQ
jgi:hypothetical protein